MERAVAVKKLRKLLGKSFGYRIDVKAPTADERAAAVEALKPAIEERNKLKEQRDARYKAILAGDAEYQSLHAAAKKASERVSELQGISMHHKIRVGTCPDNLFFHVKAEGDSWEEVIAKVQAKT